MRKGIGHLRAGGGGSWPVVPDMFFDSTYTDTNGRYVPNVAAGTSPNDNLFPLNTDEIRFGTGGSGGSTVTKRFAAGPSGTGTTAARVQWASNNVNSDYVSIVAGETVPAGTYTIVVALKSNSGAGFNIQTYESQGGTTGTLSITTSWADYSFTFTSSGATDLVRLRGTVVGGADFLIDRIRLYEGTSPPAWSVDTGGHVKAARSFKNTFSKSGNFLDLTNSTYNPAVFPVSTWPDPTTITDISVLVCASVDDTSQDIRAPIISNDSNDGVNSPVAMQVGTGNSSPESYRNSGAIVADPGSSFEYCRINIRGEGYHIWGMQANAAQSLKFFDGLKYWHYNNGLTSEVVRELCFGGTANTSKFKGKVSQAAVWINRGLTEQNMRDSITYMSRRLRAQGGGLGTVRDILMSEGDSRNANSNASPNGPGWNHQVADHEYFGAGLASLKCWNIGWGSSTLGNSSDPQLTALQTQFGTSVYSRLTLTLAKIAEAHSLGLRIHFTYICDVNDSARITSDVNAYSTVEKAYLQTIRDALDAGGLGSKLYLFTATPQAGLATYETPRANLNTLRRAYPASLINGGIIDVAADATLGFYSGTSPANSAYYDAIHWTQSGGAIAAGLAKTLIAPNRLY